MKDFRASPDCSDLRGMLSGCAILQRILPGLTMSDANIVEVLNQIDMAEIEAGELARDKGSTPEIRAFAGRVVNEHRGLVERNLRLAEGMDLEPKPPSLAFSLKQAHEKAMKELRKKSGPEFDQAYIQYEIAVHQKAVNLLETVGHRKTWADQAAWCKRGGLRRKLSEQSGRAPSTAQRGVADGAAPIPPVFLRDWPLAVSRPYSNHLLTAEAEVGAIAAVPRQPNVVPAEIESGTNVC